MPNDGDFDYLYNQTIKYFGSHPEPAFESDEAQQAVWGRVWGCDNDVGPLRTVLMHRPGPEMALIDPTKRIEATGTYGDLEEGWYWQSDRIPPMVELQAQHDAFVALLRQEGVEVVFLDGVGPRQIKACYTRDSVIAVKGGAVVCRMAPKIRRGEESVASRTLANLGMPILRTLHGTAMLEGGSFAWLNSETAVIGRSIRVNDEGIAQLNDVLSKQGVRLLVVDLCGYLIHIDGAFVMIDRDLALVDPAQLPFWFLEELKALKIRTIETNPADNGWIINGLAVAPGRVIMPPGASPRTAEALDKAGVEILSMAYDKVQLNGGGIHCSTSPLVRDSID